MVSTVGTNDLVDQPFEVSSLDDLAVPENNAGDLSVGRTCGTFFLSYYQTPEILRVLNRRKLHSVSRG